MSNPTPEATASLDAEHMPNVLSHLALLRIGGPEARAFLDGQLTRNAPTGQAPASPAGYCTPKGRLLASFVVWAQDDMFGLLLSRDIAETVVKRLKMYVLRAKVTIDDVTAGHAIVGITNPASVPDEVAALSPWALRHRDDGLWIRYPDVEDRRRFMQIATGDATGLRVTPSDGIDAATWRWLDIRSGLPLITATTQDRFVPQMLNLEALGGVDFKKGCYPGQEVVARSQYLGKLKRRMALASMDASAPVPVPGTDVWGSATNEPAGAVVNAERGVDGRTSLLIELPLALFASDALRIGAVDGVRIDVEPLPYPLPDNEVFVRPKL